jgi:hypothetical protein
LFLLFKVRKFDVLKYNTEENCKKFKWELKQISNEKNITSRKNIEIIQGNGSKNISVLQFNLLKKVLLIKI